MLSTMGITKQTVTDIANLHNKPTPQMNTDKQVLDEKKLRINNSVSELLQSLDEVPITKSSWKSSLEVLQENGESPEELRVIRVMRDVLQEKIYTLEGAFLAQDQEIKDAVKNAGLNLLRPDPGYWNAYKKAFWTSSSGPMPRQTVSSWANYCAAIGVFIGASLDNTANELVLKRNLLNSSNIPDNIIEKISRENNVGSQLSQEFVTTNQINNPFFFTLLGSFTGYTIGSILGCCAVTRCIYTEMES